MAIVALSHVQASVGGRKILERGALPWMRRCLNAVLGVTEPYERMAAICSHLLGAKTAVYGLNASGWAPRGLTIAHVKARDATHSRVKGLTRHGAGGSGRLSTLNERFGKMDGRIFFSLRFLLPRMVSRSLSHWSYWKDSADWLGIRARAQRVIYVRQASALGQVFQNRDLAKALRWWLEWSGCFLQSRNCARDLGPSPVWVDDGADDPRRVFRRSGLSRFQRPIATGTVYELPRTGRLAAL